MDLNSINIVRDGDLSFYMSNAGSLNKKTKNNVVKDLNLNCPCNEIVNRVLYQDSLGHTILNIWNCCWSYKIENNMVNGYYMVRINIKSRKKTRI